MFNKIKSLIWLRTHILLVNKNMIVLVIMPYFLSVCYKKFMNVPATETLSILFICLAMSFTFSTGNMISSFIAEEKEKNNLKTLMLSGVNSLEYIISTLFYPVILGVLAIILLPIITDNLGILTNHYLNYVLISLLTLVAVILLNLLIAMFSDTQAKAQINSLPIMFATTFLPMFAETNSTLNSINNFSFMGGFTAFFKDISNNQLLGDHIPILFTWIVILLILNVFVFKRNKLTQKNPIKVFKTKLLHNK